MKNIRIKLLLVFILLTMNLSSYAQAGIRGNIIIDTSKWAPVIYLSLIPELQDLYTISPASIIESSEITDEGKFNFNTAYLPAGDHLYRLHIAKPGDPAASLIIGGIDQNHVFLIASQNDDFQVNFRQSRQLFGDAEYLNSDRNTALKKVHSTLGIIDSLDYIGSGINKDFILEAVHKELMHFADTCPYALVSLYALYHTDYKDNYQSEERFYRRYFNKWDQEESAYFESFKKDLNYREGVDYNFLIYSGIALLLLFIGYRYLRSRHKIKRKKNLGSLTIMERKVLALLKEGKSNKEIAEEFSISLSTVKTHTNSIYSKLGVASRKEILDIED